MKKVVLMLSVFGFLSTSVSAYDKVEAMFIDKIGVSNQSDVFVVYTEQSIPDTSCKKSNEFKFKINDDATKIIVSLATTALIAQKPVQFSYDLGSRKCLDNAQSAGFVKVLNE